MLPHFVAMRRRHLKGLQSQRCCDLLLSSIQKRPGLAKGHVQHGRCVNSPLGAVFCLNSRALADIATMGALCGLASFTRQEVKEKLLEHSEFTEVSFIFFFRRLPTLWSSPNLNNRKKHHKNRALTLPSQILENAPAIHAVVKAFHNIE